MDDATRRDRSVFAALAALSVALIAAGGAMAQDIQAFQPSVGTWNYLSVHGTAVAEPGTLVPSVWLSYAREPLVLRDDQDRVIERVVDDLTTVEVLLAIGLHARFELGFALPFGYATGSGTVPIDTGAGLGDIRLDPKLRLFEAGESVRFAVAVHAPLVFPTGDEDKGASGRFFTASPGAIVELIAGRVRVAAEAGFRWRPADEDASPLTVGNGVQYAGAAAIDLGDDRDLEAMLEIYGTVYDEGPQPLELLGGLRISGPLGLAVSLGLGTGLIPDFGAPEFRVVSGLSWIPSADDDEPRIIRVAGAEAIEGAGDADGDGIKDSADACPTLPEDRDGFEDVDGCPDVDNDLDGITDAEDGCPMFAEDLDGNSDTDGCPDTDDDGDGIADGRDQCPGLAENHNGIDDTDGCPDSADVTMRADRLDVSAIYFDSGSARIKAESYPVLDQVASLIAADGGIKRLRVVGHTDAHGTEVVNDWLSRARAKRVRRYLETRGVSRGLIEVLGKGETEVFGTGLGQLDGARSRRVEFLILERDAPVLGELDDGAQRPTPRAKTGWVPRQMPAVIPPDPSMVEAPAPAEAAVMAIEPAVAEPSEADAPAAASPVEPSDAPEATDEAAVVAEPEPAVVAGSDGAGAPVDSDPAAPGDGASEDAE